MAHTDYIPYIKVGNAVRFRKARLYQQLEERTRKGRKGMKIKIL
jgi:hypothetical protein